MRELLILSYPPLGHGVPERDDAVAAAGGEGVEGGVEGQRVDGVDDVGCGAGWVGLAVAFEGVFARLGCGGGVEPFDGHAALDGAGGVAVVVRHAGDGAGEELERGFALLPGLEVGGEGLVELVDVDEAAGHGDDELGGGDGEGLRFGGEGDADGFFGGGGEVVDVEG